ncbi:hypothetical protein DJ94_5458 [Bacillus pseudomycoides]|nr:hypothetical protein DJ94_5458 [Bacillus pseudomycoides]
MNAFKSSCRNGMIPPKNFKTAIAIVIIIPPFIFQNIKNFINLLYYEFKNITICF